MSGNATTFQVYAANGTTLVDYTALQGASGDGNPALFMAQAIGSSTAEHPHLLVSGRKNATKSARKGVLTFKFPWTATDTAGVTTVKGYYVLNIDVTIPDGMPTTQIKEASKQGTQAIITGQLTGDGNFYSNGYAPT